MRDVLTEIMILPERSGEPWKRIRPALGKNREIDEEKLRDETIRQLQTSANMAYRMMRDERIDLRSRQGWLKSYTDAARTLSQVLKEREERDWEKRLRVIEEYRKRTSATTGLSGTPGENKVDPQPREGSQA